MIHDKIENVGLYLPSSIRKEVEDYLANVCKYKNDEIVNLIDEEVYGKLMEYPTCAASECKIEAHDKYIDLQFTLEGAEGISIFERDKLSVAKPMENDACFFEGSVTPIIEVKNTAGYFSIIFPWEAHRPQEKITKEGYVKKGVIKIKEKFFYE